jgi:predicted CXXCH cytochrome family protein
MSKKRASVVGWLALGICTVGVAVFVSCMTFMDRGPIMAAVTIPGAEYVGMDTCAGCHEDTVAGFRGASHAAFAVALPGEEDAPTGEGCESCHGPGSLHVDGGGDKSKILKGDWRQCFACHLDKRSQFSLRYHHPVEEGRMSCSDCHDPHEGQKPVMRVEEANERCFRCHPDKQGPYTYPHEAVTQDGCTACHTPHGSSLDKMLIANIQNLCLRCHFEGANHPAIGGFSHGGGDYILRGCQNCHSGIHGSNFSESLRHE